MNKCLERAEIVGRTVACVKQQFKLNGVEGWLDTAATYFRLDSGLSFCLPPAFSTRVELSRMPFFAKKLHLKECQPEVVGRAVTELWRPLFDGEPSDGSAFLELDSGAYVTEQIMAPHGTGAAGLYVYSKDDLAQVLEDGESLEPFWGTTVEPTAAADGRSRGEADEGICGDRR